MTLLLCGLVVAAAPQAAHAQDRYPSRAITLIAPFAPGSGTDITTRILAKDLTESLGVPVVVENRQGANGAIGAQSVARAKPDGYTLLVGSATTNAANFAFFPGKLGYESGSFDIVSGLGASTVALWVPHGSPWQTVADLVTQAKRQPGRLSCGSGNAVTQVVCEVFRKKAGIEAVNVPYKSNPQSLNDVVGNQLSYAFADTSAGQVFVAGRKLRALAVASGQRNRSLPEVPTMGELGIKDLEITAWAAVFAPAGTPDAVLDKLNTAIRKALETPEAQQQRQRSGSVALSMDLAEARRFAADEVTRWQRYVQLSGVKPEQ